MNRRQFVAGTATAVTVSLAGCGILGGGPAGAAKQYIKALADGDKEKQEELTHEDAVAVPITSERKGDVTINDVSKVSVEEVANELDGDEDEVEAQANDFADEVNADDWAYVSYDIETGRQEEGFIFLVKDGDWLVFTLFSQ